MQMWLWTLNHLQKASDADGGKLYQGSRQGVTFPLADALCWLLASRCQILDLLELEKKGPSVPTVAEGLSGLSAFLTDLCHVPAARAAGEAGRVCAELVFGVQSSPGLGHGGLRLLLSGRRSRVHGSADSWNLEPRSWIHGRN
jgi:hypothetical protein